MTVRLYDETEVRRELANAVRSAGGAKAFALMHGLKPADVDLSLKGGGFSNRMLEILDFDRVSRFVRRRGAAGRRPKAEPRRGARSWEIY